MFRRQVVNTERGSGASPDELDVVVLAVVELACILDNALKFSASFKHKDEISVDLSASSYNKHTVKVISSVRYGSRDMLYGR